MNHSTQVREFLITDKGIVLLPTYISQDGILTGSAKLEHSLKDEAQNILRKNRINNKKSEIERKRTIMEGNVTLLKTEFESEEAVFNQTKTENDLRHETKEENKKQINGLRNNLKSSAEKSKSKNN